MGDLKVKYFKTGKMLAGHFTKPLQGNSLWDFIYEIQGILEDTSYTDLVWERSNEKLIPIPQECGEKSNRETNIRTRYSQEESPEERSKYWEINTMVLMVE